MQNLMKLAGLAAMLPAALACNGYEGGVPEATDHVSSGSVIEVPAGEVYDGEWKRYDRGSGACSGQSEGAWEDAVFYLHEGATLQNVIIGKDQAEGVHCTGHCTLKFVWFEDVCEDAISIKNDAAGSNSYIIGGGAYHAGDKVIQHNGCGTVNIINYYVEDYGKVYRSCGNCDSQCTRSVNISGTTAYGGDELAGINEAFGDSATLDNICTDADHPCAIYDGCEGDCEPEKVGYC
ncbi:hypothetical protein D0863_07528 [Hortaea werneckii]|uniref:Pectate lyase n=1 Tax=Hortaea werneckii TaxID=91943 RepID=A0A3M7DUA6_HORWE|nr:hypothetical protein D0863_07528 [Hortaea werneckii]